VERKNIIVAALLPLVVAYVVVKNKKVERKSATALLPLVVAA
jgi:hypothetical protein